MRKSAVLLIVDRLHVGRALLTPSTVDVQIREDPEQPRAEVGARAVRAPAAKRTGVRLLHEILGLLTRADESPGHPVHLIGELQGLLLETHAVTGLCRDPASIALGLKVAHLSRGD